MALGSSLVIWLFLDVKHEELATDGPEASDVSEAPEAPGVPEVAPAGV